MAPTYTANLVSLVVVILQISGVHVLESDLQTTVSTLFVIGTALFTLYRQVVTGRATILGKRPQ